MSPPRSPTMVGSAMETIVWSSAARNMPSISAMNTVRSAAPVSVPSSSTFRGYSATRRDRHPVRGLCSTSAARFRPVVLPRRRDEKALSLRRFRGGPRHCSCARRRLPAEQPRACGTVGSTGSPTRRARTGPATRSPGAASRASRRRGQQPTATCSGTAVLELLGRAGRRHVEHRRADRHGRGLLGLDAAVLRLVRDVSEVPGQLQRHGDAGRPPDCVGDDQRPRALHADDLGHHAGVDEHDEREAEVARSSRRRR